MTKQNFLDALCDFSREALKDLLLPVQMQEDDETQPPPRAPEVYIMGLADFTAAKKKAPYVFHQVITARDWWEHNPRPCMRSQATVRSVAAVYHENSQEGPLALLGLFERLRIALLRQVLIGKQFKLDVEAGIEYLIYSENIYPFYVGEMVSTWTLPPVEREVTYGKQGYSNIQGGPCGRS